MLKWLKKLKLRSNVKKTNGSNIKHLPDKSDDSSKSDDVSKKGSQELDAIFVDLVKPLIGEISRDSNPQNSELESKNRNSIAEGWKKVDATVTDFLKFISEETLLVEKKSNSKAQSSRMVKKSVTFFDESSNQNTTDSKDFTEIKEDENLDKLGSQAKGILQQTLNTIPPPDSNQTTKAYPQFK